MTTPPSRTRRAHCYWEPIYDPSLVGKLKGRDWNFGTDTGPTKSYFDLAGIKPFVEGGGSRVFKNIRFSECDFQGISSNDSQVVFDKCEFLNCDLSLSTFINFKFSKCIFRGSSFGQTTFRDVEFRDCAWERMAVSSNETVLENVFISNPSDFNKSLWTQLDKQILPKKVSKINQWHRHELTKSTIARMLLNNHRELGDDRTFYESVRVFEIQQSYAKFCRAVFNTINKARPASLWYFLVAIFWIAELCLLRIFGMLNAWGASALRPLIALIALFIAGGLYYSNIKSISLPFQASFDVTTVAGYTKAVSADASASLQATFSAHLLIALVFYTVFFATIVARLSRVR